MRLIVGNREQYVSKLQWGGAYNNCIRTVSADILRQESFAVGDAVVLEDDNQKKLFTGMVTERARASDSDLINITCEDRGIYLKRNQASYSFRGISPQSIVKTVAADHGIKTASLANASGTITRNFYGVDLYSIMQTAYTLTASDAFYYTHFDGEGRLCVDALQTQSAAGQIIYEKADFKESIKSMCNIVKVYDKDNKLLTTYQNADDVQKYGSFAAVYKSSGADDGGKAAKSKLKRMETTIKASGIIGDTAYVTGSMVEVASPIAEVSGLFWIISDTHVWQNGSYTVSLDLSFDRLMDRVEAGSK